MIMVNVNNVKCMRLVLYLVRVVVSLVELVQKWIQPQPKPDVAHVKKDTSLQELDNANNVQMGNIHPISAQYNVTNVAVDEKPARTELNVSSVRKDISLHVEVNVNLVH